MFNRIKLEDVTVNTPRTLIALAIALAPSVAAADS